MNRKIACAFAVSAIFICTPLHAEEAKATKADAEKFASSLKSDPAKMDTFCQLVKMQADADAAKGDEKKLEALDAKMEALSKKLGSDFEKISTSEDKSVTDALDGVAKTCK